MPSENSVNSTKKKPSSSCNSCSCGPESLCKTFRLNKLPFDVAGTLESSLGISRERRDEIESHHQDLMKNSKTNNFWTFIDKMCEFAKNPNEVIYITLQLGANIHRIPKRFFSDPNSPTKGVGSGDDPIGRPGRPESEYGTKVTDDDYKELLNELGISDPLKKEDDDDDDNDFRRNPGFSNDLDD